jgi:hypothetical protein
MCSKTWNAPCIVTAKGGLCQSAADSGCKWQYRAKLKFWVCQACNHWMGPCQCTVTYGSDELRSIVDE